MSKPTVKSIERLYLSLLLLNTLGSSFIWGINTIFLLDAGLSNAQAFLVNAFFTVGQVIFEVPTGMVADLRGRRVSYLLGTLTLALSTLIYLGAWWIQAPLWIWAVSSILLGLGFTFFSGATEAWLVDALGFVGFTGKMESVFAKGQIVGGAAMLVGSVTGGVVAQLSSIAMPYVLRSVLLLLNFLVAFLLMKDWGFTPRKSVDLICEARSLFFSSFQFGWQRPPLRWIMFAAPFSAGVGFYAFYAMQPFLLQLYGDPQAYSVAGLAAAIVAGAQIVGGMTTAKVMKYFSRRTSMLLFGGVLNVFILLLIGLTTNFWIAILLLSCWGFIFSCSMPVRHAYINNLIPSKQRATILSFDTLISSSGGVVIQPMLGRVADIYSYGFSFMVGAVVATAALPLTFLARKQRSQADNI